jgi:hypothetical protein
MRHRAIRQLIVLACLTAACGGNSRGTTQAPTSPTSAANSAPSVTIAAQGPSSCNPVGSRTGCTVTLIATAQDRDGDPLTFAWTGTTAVNEFTGHCLGNSDAPNTATCRLYSPEQEVVGAVTVRDDRGNFATATHRVTGEGVNHPPSVRITTPPFTFPGNSVTLEMFGIIQDDDEPNLCTNQHIVSASATGDCKPNAAFWSSCLEGGPTLDVYRTAATGTCQVTLKVRDSANLVGTTLLTVRY